MQCLLGNSNVCNRPSILSAVFCLTKLEARSLCAPPPCPLLPVGYSYPSPEHQGAPLLHTFSVQPPPPPHFEYPYLRRPRFSR